MARIVGHLPVEELEARYRAARDVTTARHHQAIWLLAQGRTVLEVSEVLASVPRWVTQLAARYNAPGPEALGGEADHLPQEVGVGGLLDQGPQAHHLVGHRWSLGQVGVATRSYRHRR